MGKIRHNSPRNPLKAARKGSRDAEIAMYGHPLPKHTVHRSEKQYIRSKIKARLKKGELPFYPHTHSPKILSYAQQTILHL